MQRFSLALVLMLFPSWAMSITSTEENQIAEQLNKMFPAIEVRSVTAPYFKDDRDIVIFEISPQNTLRFGELFSPTYYWIEFNSPKEYGLGKHMCILADEYVRERRKERSNFFPPFDTSITIPLPGRVQWEIGGNEETLAQITYGILYIWDELIDDDYQKFEIMIRGYADKGNGFSKRLDDRYPIHSIDFFGPISDDLTRESIYSRDKKLMTIQDKYNNADLPLLRAAFMKRVIDSFLESCKLSAFTTKSVVLKGKDYPIKDRSLRTIEIFFYAYR